LGTQRGIALNEQDSEIVYARRLFRFESRCVGSR